jgi:hypothetical protein
MSRLFLSFNAKTLIFPYAKFGRLKKHSYICIGLPQLRVSICSGEIRSPIAIERRKAHAVSGTFVGGKGCPDITKAFTNATFLTYLESSKFKYIVMSIATVDVPGVIIRAVPTRGRLCLFISAWALTLSVQRYRVIAGASDEWNRQPRFHAFPYNTN